jgi:Protein of unknown function (DUF3105)
MSEERQQRQQVFMILFFVGIVIAVGLAVFFFTDQEEQVSVEQAQEEQVSVEPAQEERASIELAADFDFESVVDNSTAYEMIGRNHLAPDAPRDYNSNPPSSGNHNGRWVSPLGVYDQLADDQVIHNLEHGHVWLSYRDIEDNEALTLLIAIQQKYSDRVIVSYRPENDNRIAASAWTRLLVLDELDRAQIEAFIIRHGDKAPESILEG